MKIYLLADSYLNTLMELPSKKTVCKMSDFSFWDKTKMISRVIFILLFSVLIDQKLFFENNICNTIFSFLILLAVEYIILVFIAVITSKKTKKEKNKSNITDQSGNISVGEQ